MKYVSRHKGYSLLTDTYFHNNIGSRLDVRLPPRKGYLPGLFQSFNFGLVKLYIYKRLNKSVPEKRKQKLDKQ